MLLFCNACEHHICLDNLQTGLFQCKYGYLAKGQNLTARSDCVVQCSVVQCSVVQCSAVLLRLTAEMTAWVTLQPLA